MNEDVTVAELAYAPTGINEGSVRRHERHEVATQLRRLILDRAGGPKAAEPDECAVLIEDLDVIRRRPDIGGSRRGRRAGRVSRAGFALWESSASAQGAATPAQGAAGIGSGAGSTP